MTFATHGLEGTALGYAHLLAELGDVHVDRAGMDVLDVAHPPDLVKERAGRGSRPLRRLRPTAARICRAVSISVSTPSSESAAPGASRARFSSPTASRTKATRRLRGSRVAPPVPRAAS